jgi:SAM-dependent methyltransferase
MRTTSSLRPDADRRTPPIAERLASYYARYYRDTLGLPGWQDLVAVRVADHDYEGRHLARLERALDRRLEGCRLLNVGCGTGGFSLLAREAGARVCSIDASVEAAGIAADRGGDAVVCAEAERLPVASASTDIVYCFSTLEHVADARAALREMVRVLAPGGLLYLHTPHRWACFEGHYKVLWLPRFPRALARAYLTLRGRPTAFLDTLHPLTLRECRQYLGEAGADIVRVLDEDGERRVGGRLWPLIRLYYRLFRIHPYLELVAVRRERA